VIIEEKRDLRWLVNDPVVNCDVCEVVGAGAEVTPLQSTAGTLPTVISMSVVCQAPVSPSRPDKMYCPGVKVVGTSHVQLPVFGTLPASNKLLELRYWKRLKGSIGLLWIDQGSGTAKNLY
jgi:hypothetical protein